MHRKDSYTSLNRRKYFYCFPNLLSLPGDKTSVHLLTYKMCMCVYIYVCVIFSWILNDWKRLNSMQLGAHFLQATLQKSLWVNYWWVFISMQGFINNLLITTYQLHICPPFPPLNGSFLQDSAWIWTLQYHSLWVWILISFYHSTQVQKLRYDLILKRIVVLWGREAWLNSHYLIWSCYAHITGIWDTFSGGWREGRCGPDV